MLICAAISSGDTVIDNLPMNDDISATVSCIRELGVSINLNCDTAYVRGCGGAFSKDTRVLHCRESGSTLRFLLPLALTDGVETVFKGSARLFERPTSVYEDICRKCGALWIPGENSLSVRGVLKHGNYPVPGNISSQFVSGLLFALPLLGGDSSIEITTPLESASYIDLTLDALGRSGFSVIREGNRYYVPGSQKAGGADMKVPGDESGAAFFGALNALGSSIDLEGLDPQTLQGDRVWRDLFRQLEKGYCTISVADCPDLAPILMTMAVIYHNGCRLTDTARLRFKESDRGNVMARELAKVGAKISVNYNYIEIGDSVIHAPDADFDSHNDHRVAMSLAVLATVTGGTVRGAESVGKSMPEFWDLLKSVGVDVTLSY